MKPTILAIDIETTIAKDATEYKPEFYPASNLVDEKKIEENVWTKQKKWENECALSPLTGQVCAIGYGYEYPESEIPVIHVEGDPTGQNEDVLLKSFWKRFREVNGITIGHNIIQFDLPYLWLRSLKHGIIPHWSPPFHYADNTLFTVKDTMDMWNAKRYPKQYISLDDLARFFGVGRKTGNGADFAKKYYAKETRKEAEDYLKNDIELVGKIYKRFTI